MYVFFRLFQSGQISPAWDSPARRARRLVSRGGILTRPQTIPRLLRQSLLPWPEQLSWRLPRRLVSSTTFLSFHGILKKHGKLIIILLASYPHSFWGIASLFSVYYGGHRGRWEGGGGGSSIGFQYRLCTSIISYYHYGICYGSSLLFSSFDSLHLFYIFLLASPWSAWKELRQKDGKFGQPLAKILKDGEKALAEKRKRCSAKWPRLLAGKKEILGMAQ